MSTEGNKMTGKEFLLSIRHNEKRIKALKERKKQYYELSVNSTAWDKTGKKDGINQSSRVEDAVCKMDDLISRIDVELSTLNHQIIRAEAIISSMENTQHKDVLTYRYLNCWPWKRVSEHMELEKRQVFNLHEKALEAFEKKMEEESREA